MNFDVAGAIGKRVSIRLREGEGELSSYRDLLGVLEDEKTVVKSDGSRHTFDDSSIAYFRVVPLFNRQNHKHLPLSLYETASRQLREITSDSVRIYSCGPTVYRDAHIGNMRTFLLTDLVRRAIRINGAQTITVSNITDVGHMSENLDGSDSGDKVLEEAAREKVTPIEIARRYEEKFRADLHLLNIESADFFPRASENIHLIIEYIERLLEIGAAYQGSDGNIYFDAKSCSDYGFISGNKLDSLKPGHRYEYEGDGGKRFHADWALWKLAGKRTEMIWESPWGAGFPGWHIECSAMSLQLLGNSIDLHIGGIDLRFPHHENERAQSNAVAGLDVVSHWLHGEHLLFEGRKMAKSSGNVILVSDLIGADLDPLSLRLNLLENRYRSQMDLSWNSLRAADTTLRRWREAMARWGDSSDIKFDEDIYRWIMNDLELPKVIVRLREIEKDPTIGSQDKRGIFLFADQVLGLDLDRGAPLTAEVELEAEMVQLLHERAEARADGNWGESDRLRDLLASHGIIVRDGRDGQSWEFKS